MFGTERRCVRAVPERPRFNDQPWFRFGAPHVYQRGRRVAKIFPRLCRILSPKLSEIRGLAMGVSRVLFAALFLSLTVTVVNAYTVVMRDGRRVEIPNEFTVTNSTLTYDIGNDMQVTIQL